MMQIIQGLNEIEQAYDAFLVDAWGVLHDGARTYTGVLNCLDQLVLRARPVLVLSNAARRHDAMRAELAALGVAGGQYYDLLSSGEMAWQALCHDRTLLGLGDSAFYLGPERSRGICAGLDLEWVDDPARADFVLNAGAPQGNPADAEHLRPLLLQCLSKDLPMICANPDQVAIRAGVAGISAGAIAALYAKLGASKIHYFGKPAPEFLHQALQSLPQGSGTRVLMIGDGCATDIAGAINAGIDSLLIAGGIHASALNPLDQEHLLSCVADFNVIPNYVCASLRW